MPRRFISSSEGNPPLLWLTTSEKSLCCLWLSLLQALLQSLDNRRAPRKRIIMNVMYSRTSHPDIPVELVSSSILNIPTFTLSCSTPLLTLGLHIPCFFRSYCNIRTGEQGWGDRGQQSLLYTSIPSYCSMENISNHSCLKKFRGPVSAFL